MALGWVIAGCGTPGEGPPGSTLSGVTLDDGCTGAACCEGGCPSTNPETGADDGDDAGESSSGDGDDMASDDVASDGDEADEAEAGDAADTVGGGEWGVCRRTCAVAQDCCAGAGECPWFACLAGVCAPAPCTEASCEAAGGQTYSCLSIDGYAQCVGDCGDACSQPNSSLGCSGIADDGTMYCHEPCDSPWWSCAEGQTCDAVTGRCFCTSDAACGESEVCDPV